MVPEAPSTPTCPWCSATSVKKDGRDTPLSQSFRCRSCHQTFTSAQFSARLMSAHGANRIDGTDRLLALLNFEIWARIYLDRRMPADVADELKISVA